MRNIFSIIIFLLSLTANLFAQNIKVVPKPKEITKINEGFSLNSSTVSIKISIDDTTGIYITTDEIKETFIQFTETEISNNKNSSNIIWLGIPADDKDFKKACEENVILESDKIGEDGYSLTIKNKLILIAANTKAGIYYGVQTLKQIIRSNKNQTSLPGIKIIDYPSLRYRGILDDISRGPVPTMEYMKQQIRRLAELKMNSIQYYIENVVKTESHPKFAPPDGSITIEQIKELSEYAEKYHVMLIGNFQSFGHFEKILAHPDYAHLGEGGTLLSPAFPESIELLEDIYTEMIPAFDSPFFNINSDETFDLGKGASKPLVDSLGMAVVYTDQVKKMYEIVNDFDVRMMMWTDIVLKNPGSLELLPKDIIMMTWGYDASESFDDMILPVKNAGFDFTISPGVLNSYSTMPDYSVTTTNIKNFVRDGVKHGAMGMVLTIWDDGGSAFFSRDWYGAAYGADQSWNSNDENISSFNKRFNSAIYSDESGSLTDVIWKLLELSKVSVTDRMQEKLLWTKVMPDSGESLRIGIEGWDKVIEIVDSAEMILADSNPELYKKDYAYFQFTTDQYRYFANLRFNLLEAANQYAEAFKNQNENRKSSRENIIKAIASLSNSRNSLVKLYNDYRNLWLMENKTNAVDKMLQKYQNHIDDLKDIEGRIFTALKNFDSHLNIASPKEVRLGIEEGKGKYFREWMMINPVPNPEGSEGNSVDYLKAMGGELSAVPKVTQEFVYNDSTYRWRRTESEYFDIVDLAEEFPERNNNSATYAFATIESPDDRTVIASLGSSDGTDVIVNGKLIYGFRKERSLNIDEDKFQLQLKKGKNNLMLKFFQGSGDWKFTFQLPDYKVSNSKNRYKIPE